MKRENTFPLQAPFLDLSMYTEEYKLNTTLCDKRDASPLSIVRIPYRDINLPSKIFCASITSEILRLARINSEKSLFINTTKIILKRM